MIKVLALICSIASPDSCTWKTVTTSDMASNLTMIGCQSGMPELANWMRGYPGYRLQKWPCQFGDRPERSAT